MAKPVAVKQGMECSNVPRMSYFGGRTFDYDFGDILGTSRIV
jgi:hypothetical protein